ncbi:MAG TPA: family 2 glycosyl transferase [Cyanobacteria bacterium UBA8803]|nr:family 2 glycosyl transferase [Cyanobacteria bacterium UBA9273]HBL61322.1 family 2 glycosyl transferase [Cyanobacteria bacterium UBA8803]
MSINYPVINTTPDDSYRPFWSVMIPTYNNTRYLKQTLLSVLEQDPGLHEMQIEVIDDCSKEDDPEAIVREIGQGRISFSRQPHNVGQVENWNTCIERACGHWIHILHQDDLVMPGFYSRLREVVEKEQTSGAAFCRYIYIDEDDIWQSLSPLESRTPGILLNWLECIAVVQRIQFPAIVVKRSTYEKIGGFCPQAYSVADWEMWKRIAAHFPVCYEPQVLACFRLHSASESSRLIQSGANISHVRHAINITQSYLPKNKAHELSYKAREHYALYALNTARQLLADSNRVAAIAQIREALKCSYSFRVVISLLKLIQFGVKQQVKQAVRTVSF